MAPLLELSLFVDAKIYYVKPGSALQFAAI